MSGKAFAGLAAVLLLLVVVSKSVYVVNEMERALVLRFGEVVEPNVAPGLHFKIPIVHTVRKFDSRVQTLDTRPQDYLTQEKKRLIVDSYVKWRIANVRDFYTSTSGIMVTAEDIIASRMDTGLRNKFGQRSLNEVVSSEREEMMTELTNELDRISKEELGIEVIDVRVKRIDLPTEVSQSVYDRMRSERQREAQELRSEGKELGEGIRADADRQKTVILAEAERDAERTRGNGDAQAAAIYATAFGQDTEFYAFYRSLNAYRKTFANKSDVMVLEPDSAFFRYLNTPTPENPASP